MRGRIIHYSPNDARGLIAAEGRQYVFELAQWQDDIAPATNQTVDFAPQGSRAHAVSVVPASVLLKESLRRRLGWLLRLFQRPRPPPEPPAA